MNDYAASLSDLRSTAEEIIKWSLLQQKSLNAIQDAHLLPEVAIAIVYAETIEDRALLMLQDIADAYPSADE